MPRLAAISRTSSMARHLAPTFRPPLGVHSRQDQHSEGLALELILSPNAEEPLCRFRRAFSHRKRYPPTKDRLSELGHRTDQASRRKSRQVVMSRREAALGLVGAKHNSEFRGKRRIALS